MLSILSCNACGVIVALVSVQVQVHGPARVLLNKVDFNVVVKMVCVSVVVAVLAEVGVVDEDNIVLKVVKVVCENKVLVVVCEDKIMIIFGVFVLVEATFDDKVSVVVAVLGVVGVVDEDKLVAVVCAFTVMDVVGEEIVDVGTVKVVETVVATKI